MMRRSPKRISVLTSGGDAPGMNACIRSIVRSAAFYGVEVLGIHNGYDGLISGKATPLTLRSVGNLIQRGGTFLGSSRSEAFRTKAGRRQAYQFLKSQEVDALIVLGGDGTLAGAGVFSKEFDIQVAGIPCTIDNDLMGTDLAIGYDTAINTAVDCIDKIRDTADSHGRVFVVEVMGKNTGHLALEVALAVGAESVVIPEVKINAAKVIAKIQAGIDRGKTGSIIVVAEKHEPGFSMQFSEQIRKRVDRDVRTVILGHLQRGGSPSSVDRNLASRLGAHAVETLMQKKTRLMAGLQHLDIVSVPFETVISKRRYADLKKLDLVDRLSM